MAKIVLPAGEGGQFPVIDEGVYKLKISGPKLAYARGTGAPTVECFLEVMEGKEKGTRLYHQYSLQKQALWKLKMDMRALGLLDPSTYPEGQEIELEDEDIVAMLDEAEGYGSIFTDMYQGSPRSKLATPGFLTAEQFKRRAPKPVVKPAVKRELPTAQEPF